MKYLDLVLLLVWEKAFKSGSIAFWVVGNWEVVDFWAQAEEDH